MAYQYSQTPFPLNIFSAQNELQMDDVVTHDGASINGRFLHICGQSLTTNFVENVLGAHQDNEQVVGVILQNLMPQVAATAAMLLQQYPRYERLYLVELGDAAIAELISALRDNTTVLRIFLQELEPASIAALADFIKNHQSIYSVVFDNLSEEMAEQVYKKLSGKEQIWSVPKTWVRNAPQLSMMQLSATLGPALFQLPPDQSDEIMQKTTPNVLVFKDVSKHHTSYV